jgi:PAS domain S-box-containing protein
MASPPPDPASSASATTALGADFHHLLEHLDDGILFLDRQWRIVYANRAARRISRMEPGFLNGATHWELYPTTVGTEQERIYRRSMDERVSIEHEFYYPPFDVWIQLRTFPIPTGIAVHYRDVSQLKQANTRREASARQLQQVFDVTSDAIMLLDREYRVTFLNRRGAELLSRSGEIVGRNLFQVFPGIVYKNSPYVATYGQAMEKGLGGYFEAYYPDPLNLWFAVEAHPTDEGIIVFFRDISHERAAAEELERKTSQAQAQAAEIETVYRTAPIGLALFEPKEFRYVRLNDRQAAFFGLTPEQVVGRTLTEMAPIPGLQELFEQVRAGTPVINYPLEGELISHPGEHRYWTVNYSPVQAPDGTVQAISAASLEITAQKKAEKALIQSEKLAAVGRLASSISHEINNPLESVTNLLYLIAAEDHLPPEVRTYVELTQAEIARVSQIATQTLRFHRQASLATRVSARQLVEPVLKLHQARLTNCSIGVVTTFVSKHSVLCLENEIRQVLNNLIGNAIDAMRTGGRLSIRSHDAHHPRTAAAGVRLTVADDGHGMSSETKARIFEPFFTTKDLNGTGLGLWISTEIVQRHAGTLTVRSSQHPICHGTVFSLFLPLGEGAEEI